MMRSIHSTRAALLICRVGGGASNAFLSAELSTRLMGSDDR
jgi:hypothetical protein